MNSPRIDCKVAYGRKQVDFSVHGGWCDDLAALVDVIRKIVGNDSGERLADEFARFRWLANARSGNSPWLTATSNTDAYSITVDAAGDVRVFGVVTGYSPYMAKLSGANLSVLAYDAWNTTGGYGYSGEVDQSGNLVVSAMAIFDNSGRPGGQAGLLLRFNGSSSTLLTQTVWDLIPPSGGKDYYPIFLSPDASGNIFLGGYGSCGAVYAPFIAKVSPTQTMLAFKYFVFPSGVSQPAYIRTDKAGNLYCFITTWNGDVNKVAILKFDNSLNFVSGYTITITGTVTGVIGNGKANSLQVKGDGLSVCWSWISSTENIPIFLATSVKQAAFLKTGAFVVGGKTLTIASLGSVSMTSYSSTKYSPTNGITSAGATAAAAPSITAAAVGTPSITMT